MPITYAVDPERNLILVTFAGRITAHELGDHWKEFLSKADVMNCRRSVADIRQSILEFSGSELDTMIQHIVLPLTGTRKWRTAIVVDQPVQQGVARQYEVFADMFSEDELFFDLEAAVEWVLSGLPE